MRRGAKNVIFDTNVWVSYFIGAKTAEAARLIVSNGLDVYSSPELEAELAEVLGRKKFSKYITLPIERLIAFQRKLTIMFPTEARHSGCPDPKDNFLFDLAMQSPAKTIVTGDKLLQGLSGNGITIVSPAVFKSML